MNDVPCDDGASIGKNGLTVRICILHGLFISILIFHELFQVISVEMFRNPDHDSRSQIKC